MSDHNIRARGGHMYCLVFVKHIGRCKQVLLVRELYQLDFLAEAHVRFLKIGSEVAVNEPNGREVLHAGKTNLLDLRSRVLSDGDLFAIISGGAGDSDMPAYDRALDAEQRWDLVAYMRELQSNSADLEIAPSP